MASDTLSAEPTPSIATLTDDYAKLAATDQSTEITVSAREARTHQSEEDFRREKEGYEAKIDDGEIWKRLTLLDPPFLTDAKPESTSAVRATESAHKTESGEEGAAKPLGRKIFLLVSAAVGELYWEEKYGMVGQICDWLEGEYALDEKMAETVRRWREKSERGLEKEG